MYCIVLHQINSHQLFDVCIVFCPNGNLMDVIIAGKSPSSSFLLKVDQLWTHRQVLIVLSGILSVPITKLHVTDFSGNIWLYPQDRARSTTIIVHTVPVTQPQVPTQVPTHRGGNEKCARTF